MEKIFHVGIDGDYSKSCDLDSTINYIYTEEWDEDEYKEVVLSVIGDSFYKFPQLESLNKDFKIFFDSCHDGSRQIDGVLLAENEEEALKKAKEWAEKNYKVSRLK